MMKDTKNSIIDGLKGSKDVVNESAMGEYDAMIQSFIKDVVTFGYSKMGSHDLKAIDRLTELVHGEVGKKIFDLVSKELTNQLKKAINK